MKRILCGLILMVLMALPLCVSGQTAAPQASAKPAGSITFTFNVPCDGCSTQNGEAGDNHYLIEVPASNNPLSAVSEFSDELIMQVKIKSDHLIYAIPFKPGSSPRAVWRNGGRVLQVFLIPLNAAQTETTRTIIEPQPTRTQPANSTESEAAKSDPGPITTSIPPRTFSHVSTATVAPQGPATVSQPVNLDARGSTALTAVDMAVPESPAFTVLGVTPETVTRPTSPRAFATSLLNGIDQNGNFQSGLALDFAPYLLIAGDQLTLRKYQTQPFTRLLSRTQFSFGTAKGASDSDKSMRLALGFHATLWDRGDPRMDQDLIDCLGTMKLPRVPSILEPELPDHPTASDLKIFGDNLKLYGDEKARYERDKQAAIEFNNGVSTRCRDASQKKNWNKSSWIVAAAPSWISTTGQTKNYRWNGGGFWTSLAYGFEGVPVLEDRSQLIVHARYRNREQVPDANNKGKFLTQDTMFFGARFRYGSPTFNGSFEYTFLRSRLIGKPFDNSSRLALDVERKIAGDTWFNLSLGGETGRSDGKNNGFVITSFKWAFSDRKNVSTPSIQ
jgi:hypothetical protein